jgi:hypothetical protein
MLPVSSAGHSASLGNPNEYGATPRQCYEGNDGMHIGLPGDFGRGS